MSPVSLCKIPTGGGCGGADIWAVSAISFLSLQCLTFRFQIFFFYLFIHLFATIVATAEAFWTLFKYKYCTSGWEKNGKFLHISNFWIKRDCISISLSVYVSHYVAVRAAHPPPRLPLSFSLFPSHPPPVPDTAPTDVGGGGGTKSELVITWEVSHLSRPTVFATAAVPLMVFGLIARNHEGNRILWSTLGGKMNSSSSADLPQLWI